MPVLDPSSLFAIAAVISSLSNLIWSIRRPSPSTDRLLGHRTGKEE
jgi:hypothetical protein